MSVLVNPYIGNYCNDHFNDHGTSNWFNFPSKNENHLNILSQFIRLKVQSKFDKGQTISKWIFHNVISPQMSQNLTLKSGSILRTLKYSDLHQK